MPTNQFKTLAKKLIQVTTRPSWASTMNLLLVSIGVRDAYYNDDDIPFTTFSCAYQKAFLELMTFASVRINFETSGRWLLYTSKVNLPAITSDATLGKLLKFPCSPKAMDIAKETSKKVGVEFRIDTGAQEVLVTQFFCFKSELPKISRWFQAMREGLAYLKSLGLFRTFQPLLVIETYEKKGKGNLESIGVQKFMMDL